MMEITYYGHACFGVNLGGTRLLFDPFITPNPLASSIDVNAIQADYILISHGHMDHVADAEVIAQRTEATIISNFEIVSWFEGKGLKKVHPMNHGGKYSFDFGVVKYVNAIHSSVLPDGTYGGNPGGFVVSTESGCFYYAGDTALTMDMKLIGEFSDVDFAFLPIGDNFTMGIDDALICSDFIQCDNIIGMHYNTFPPVVIDEAACVALFRNAGKQLSLLTIGESINF
jgi:L-ascorbate metabolism protein UlaG (beta-lactamase superfamily)